MNIEKHTGKPFINILFLSWMLLPCISSDSSLAKEPQVELPADSQVGPQEDGRIIVPTNQILSPAGRQVIVGGRPTDVAN